MSYYARWHCALAALGIGLFHSAAPAQDAPSAALESYHRARAVLDAGVHAAGGSEALLGSRSIRRELFETWFDPTQGPRPWRGAPSEEPPPNAGFDRSEAQFFVDYAGNRWFEQRRYADSPTDYAIVLEAVTAERGFRSIRYVREKPFYDAFDPGGLAALRVRMFRRHPEGILRSALARPETLQWTGTSEVAGRSQDVISFADSLGNRLCLYFDRKTHLLTRVESLRDHPVAGDATSDTTFFDYRPVGRLMLPHKYLDRTAGVPTRKLEFAKIEVDGAAPEEAFVPPADYVAVRHDPDTPTLEQISPSLYLIRGSYNVMFSVFPDHVVVFEAPAGEAYVRECLRLIEQAAPGKPIRHVVASHFHYDHIAGLRTFVARGVPILAPADAVDAIQRAARSTHTMRPDSLSRNPSEPVVEVIAGRKLFEEGPVRAHVYDFGPTPHVDQILVTYFPDEKVLYVADLMDVLTDELVIAGVDAVPMRARMRQLGLQVERFVPVHGMPISGAQLEKAYEIRAKYVP